MCSSVVVDLRTPYGFSETTELEFIIPLRWNRHLRWLVAGVVFMPRLAFH
jgi:hypothetical protein